MSRAQEMRIASTLATAAAERVAKSISDGYKGRALLAYAQSLRDAADRISATFDSPPAPPPPTRTVGVREYGTVSMSWHYLVDVDAGLADEDAHAEAIRVVKAGDVDSYDSSTGDATSDDSTYGTDILEEWQTRPADWGSS